VAWNPDNENRPITVDEFLRIVEQKYPGITRSPHLRNALYSASGQNPSIEAMLANIDPVRFRANARIKGYAKPLTDEQHTLVFKRHANVRTRHVSNPGIKQIARTRRNYGPGTKENIRGLFEQGIQIYVSTDRAVIALRELIQNAADAINDPKRGSKALGQIGKNAGKIDVTFDREARTLTVEDNGCGMTPEVIRTFVTLTGTTKGLNLTWEDRDPTPEEMAILFPPMKLSIRAFPRNPEGIEPPSGGRYWIRINGLYQFDKTKSNYDRILPSDYVFDFTSSSPVGGFGVAKAVIFLASIPGDNKPPRWELHTQDNFYTGEMAYADTGTPDALANRPVKVEQTKYRQGSKFTIFDLDPNLFDRTAYVYKEGTSVAGSSDSIETRMKRVLEANDLSGITITFNRSVIKPRFSQEATNIVQFGDSRIPWFDGIFLHPEYRANPPESLGESLTDVSSNPRNLQKYPLTSGRDAFRNNYAGYFGQFQNSVEMTPDDLKPKVDSGTLVFDPLQENPPEEILDLLDKVRQSDEFREAVLAARAGTIDSADIMKEAIQEAVRAEGLRQEEMTRRGQEIGGHTPKVTSTEEQTTEVAKISEEIEKTVTKLEEEAPARQFSDRERILNDYADKVETYLDNLNRSRERQNMTTLFDIARQLLVPFGPARVGSAIRNIDESGYGLVTLFQAQKVVTRAAMSVGAGGAGEALSFDTIISKIIQLVQIPRNIVNDARERAGITNILGSIYGFLVIRGEFTVTVEKPMESWDPQAQEYKKQRGPRGKVLTIPTPVFDEKRYKKFTDNIDKYSALLPLWDKIVRLIAELCPKHKLSFPLVTGFVLTDKAYAVQITKRSHMVLIQPIFAYEAKKVYKNAADLAMYLHAMACHELAHAYRGTPHSKDGHDEEFSIIREDLAINTVGILPVITPLVAKWAKLRNPFAKESVKDLKIRYREIAEEITCPTCLKQAVETLEKGGRLDTVHWIKQQIGWDSDPLDPRSHDSIE